MLAAVPLAACSAALCCRQGCTVAEALKTGMLSPEYQRSRKREVTNRKLLEQSKGILDTPAL